MPTLGCRMIDPSRIGAGLAALLCLGAQAAAADGWQTFQDRCLSAFEQFEQPDVQGLPTVELSTTQRERHAASAEAVGYAFKVGTVLVFDTEPEWDTEAFLTRSCSVTNPADAGQVEFDNWREEQIAQGRYRLSEESREGWQVLETIEWIEPRLVMIRSTSASDDAVTYVIAETTLET